MDLIYVSDLAITYSYDELSPVLRNAIAWGYNEFSFQPFGTYWNEIWIKIQNEFTAKKYFWRDA